MLKSYLGYALVTVPGARHFRVGNGTLPLTRQMHKPPVFFEDFDVARRAARALRKVLGLRLKPVSAWAP